MVRIYRTKQYEKKKKIKKCSYMMLGKKESEIMHDKNIMRARWNKEFD